MPFTAFNLTSYLVVLWKVVKWALNMRDTTRLRGPFLLYIFEYTPF